MARRPKDEGGVVGQAVLFDCAPKRKRRETSPAKKRRQLHEATFDALNLLDREKKEPEVFDGADARILVGVHAYFYEKILGVFPDDLAGDYPKAVGAARRMLTNDFAGSAPKMLGFIRWAWRREQHRERRRRADGQGGRLTWQRLFGRYVLQDWRVDQERQHKRRR